MTEETTSCRFLLVRRSSHRASAALQVAALGLIPLVARKLRQVVVSALSLASTLAVRAKEGTVKTKTRKVIAFLHPFYFEKYGFIPCGAFGTAVSPEGDKVYITWNGNRDTKEIGRRVKFDICAFMVVHIPEPERMP